MYEFCQWNMQNVYLLVDCAQTGGHQQSSEPLIPNSENNLPPVNSRDETAARSEAIPSNQAQKPYNGKGCRPLYCDRCGKVFYLKSNLRSHMMSYKYPCNVCTEFFRTKTEIMLHVQEKHGLPVSAPVETYQYPCTECDFKTQNSRTLTEHILRQHTDKYAYVCEICPREFKVKSDLTHHMKLDHLVTKCFICGSVCRDQRALVSHIANNHGDQPYQCKRCKRTLESQVTLDRHMKWHSDIARRSSVTCPKCGKLIRDYKFSAHMLMHNDRKSNTCPICKKYFRRLSSLKIHLLDHSGQKPFACDVCEKKFSEEKALRRHRRRQHPGPQQPPPSGSVKSTVKDVSRDVPVCKTEEH